MTRHETSAQSSLQRNAAGGDARPRCIETVVGRQIAGETIIVPIKSTAGELDDIFTLNEVASRTWDLIDGSRTIDSIAGTIASEYDVSPGRVLSDTVKLISDFQQAEIVTLETDGTSPGGAVS